MEKQVRAKTLHHDSAMAGIVINCSSLMTFDLAMYRTADKQSTNEIYFVSYITLDLYTGNFTINITK